METKTVNIFIVCGITVMVAGYLYWLYQSEKQSQKFHNDLLEQLVKTAEIPE